MTRLPSARREAYSAPILETLQRSGLNIDQTIVRGSGVLALEGIRRARDLDVEVAPEVFNSLSYRSQTKHLIINVKPGHNPVVLTAQADGLPLPIDITTPRGSYAEECFQYDLDNAETDMHGVKHLPLDDLRREKLRSQRPKDFIDLGRIWLARHRES